jgi:16S rRNA (cytosine967-C5)-methyltransferase
MPIDIVRDAAVDVLLRVFEKHWFLSESLDRTIQRKVQLSERGRRFLTQLVYGTVRYRLLCDHVLTPLLRQPLEELPPPILAILRMGVYQSLFCDTVTTPAMVHTSVDLAKRRGNAGTARLVNAILRRVPQTLDTVALPAPEANIAQHLSLRFSIPLWLVERWITEFGAEEAQHLCEVCNTQAPVSLRVNLQKNSVEELQARLTKTGLLTHKKTDVPDELTLAEGGQPVRSKLFTAGHFLVQDPASMLPAHLMEPKDGDWILDVCAAPGGKATHLAQLAPAAWVVAMDLDPARLRSIRENIDRLGVENIQLLCGDGKRSPLNAEFDRILVDAPCSGLGTIRRHPDLKWRLQPDAIPRLAREQQRLLRSAIAHCKIGGLVVYSVCTFTPEETEGVVNKLLSEGQVQTEAGPDWMNTWQIKPGQYRILPQKEALDGFYLTRLRKVS